MNVKQIITTMAAVGSIALMGACSSGTPTPAVTKTVTVPGPTVTVTAQAAPAPAVTVTQQPQENTAVTDDGIYQVGVDIKPGTYVAKGPFDPDTGCYWARLKSADPNDEISNDLKMSGQSIVTIKKSDADFETEGCGTWTKR